MKFLLVFVSFFFFLQTAQAKLFQNSYISFEIPETWNCKAFGSDWVCHSKLQNKQVEALITSTAKIAGSMDTLNDYLNYLQQEKTWVNIKKEQITSKKIGEVKKTFINRFPWVDGIHKNSEVKSYISRYAGTVCCKDSSSKLGILVVLSAHQDHYTKYSGEFVKTINSLRVMNIEKAIAKVRANQSSGVEADMSSYLEGLFDDSQGEAIKGTSSKIFGLNFSQLALLGLIFLIILIYLIMKKKKGKNRSRKSRSHKKR